MNVLRMQHDLLASYETNTSSRVKPKTKVSRVQPQAIWMHSRHMKSTACSIIVNISMCTLPASELDQGSKFYEIKQN